MGTLEELDFYCRKEKPVGAMAFLGESGSGKTHLIEKDLRDMMKDTHLFVRVSLFGVNSIAALHTAVKRQWVQAVVPLRSKKKKGSEGKELGESLFKTAKSLLKFVNPTAGKIADAASDPIEYIVVKPVVEDIRTRTKKRVVLVFDDMERSRIDLSELLGCINEYCENKHFNTILIADSEAFAEADPKNVNAVREAREKAVAYSLYHYPDFERVVHQVITERSWKTEEYAEYLKGHEQTVLSLFGQELPEAIDEKVPLGKHHNIRSLITALESFYRVYYHMTKAGIRDPEPYLCSYVSFYLAEKSGILRNGKTCYDPSDEEIMQLYPRFSPDTLFKSVRQWIRLGYWDKPMFMKELAAVGRVRGTGSVTHF